MLKRVLVKSGESADGEEGAAGGAGGGREEDKQSHHSDSVMEHRRTPRTHRGTHTLV